MLSSAIAKPCPESVIQLRAVPVPDVEPGFPHPTGFSRESSDLQLDCCLKTPECLHIPPGHSSAVTLADNYEIIVFRCAKVKSFSLVVHISAQNTIVR